MCFMLVSPGQPMDGLLHGAAGPGPHSPVLRTCMSNFGEWGVPFWGFFVNPCNVIILEAGRATS